MTTQTIEMLSQGFSEVGYRLECNTTTNIARLMKPTPKAKYQKEKQVYGVRFQTTERMFEKLTSELEYYKNQIIQKQKEKEESKIRKELETQNVQVGDIFHASWGYEQTNVNFYQVVSKPSAKTVILREVAYKTVSVEGVMSDRVQPVKDHFIGDEIKMRLNGNYITFNSYKSASKIEDTTKTFYRSWYY